MITTDILLRLLAALVAGSLLGLEREIRQKPAGFRTITLITVGAAVFTILSIEIGAPNSPDRIASNILPGIGFLGAGVIFRGSDVVRGITTAATVWSAAALGLAAGSGEYALTGLAVFLMLVILEVFDRMEESLFAFGRHVYIIQLPAAQHDTAFLEQQLRQLRLHFRKIKFRHAADGVQVQFEVAGRSSRLRQWSEYLTTRPEVLAFEY